VGLKASVMYDSRAPKSFTLWSKTERDDHVNKNECMCHGQAYDTTSMLRFLTASWREKCTARLLLERLD
jgi:hypothetical protein